MCTGCTHRGAHIFGCLAHFACAWVGMLRPSAPSTPLRSAQDSVRVLGVPLRVSRPVSRAQFWCAGMHRDSVWRWSGGLGPRWVDEHIQLCVLRSAFCILRCVFCVMYFAFCVLRVAFCVLCVLCVPIYSTVQCGAGWLEAVWRGSVWRCSGRLGSGWADEYLQFCVLRCVLCVLCFAFCVLRVALCVLRCSRALRSHLQYSSGLWEG